MGTQTFFGLGAARAMPRHSAALSLVIAALFASVSPAYAVLDAEQCQRIASTGQGVYDLAIRNGSSAADAQASAQSTVKRRVREESGKTSIKTMEDAIIACGATGLTNAVMCRYVSGYYAGPPC